ncbi:alpha-1,2-fucosyltransferase [Capnocytophaga canis]|uniref:alpha-1,2-fucosyltransferase n=1 Tax=Capnocytophaga canis TaxID=1848903 RepID=UPI0037D806EA
MKGHYVCLQGGLGNQLYILGYAFYLQEQGCKNVCLFYEQKQKGDTTDTQKRNIIHNLPKVLGLESLYISSLLLKVLRNLCKLPIISKLVDYYEEPGDEWAVFIPFSPPKKKKIKVHVGYYQSFHYQTPLFIEKLKQFFFKNVLLEHFFPVENDVAIHIRRGDFLTGTNAMIYSEIGVKYYLEGLEKLNREQGIGKVYVFSDDFQAIINDIKEISKIYTVELMQGNSVLQDIRMLMCFKRYVLGNSTFAWWGAKLSEAQNPRVVVPATPWKINFKKEVTPYPKNWILLEN